MGYIVSPCGPLPTPHPHKKCPRPRGHKLEHRNKERQFKKKNFSETGRLRVLIFSIYFSLWISTKFVHMMPLESKLAQPLGHKLKHRKKEAHLQNSSLKPEGVEL